MKKLLIPLLTLLFILTGCSSKRDAANVSELRATTGTVEKTAADVKKGTSVCNYNEPGVFDFDELSKNDFPRGEWSINQLIKKYGTPQKNDAYYYDGYGSVYIDAKFSDIDVSFSFAPAKQFSFYKESLASGKYKLNENDKNLKLEILALSTSNKNVKLPRGLKIGQSTKAQVLEAYPKRSCSYEDINSISYFYDQKLMGNIDYVFDKNGILERVSVSWRFFEGNDIEEFTSLR